MTTTTPQPLIDATKFLNDTTQLRAELQTHGYLYLRGVAPGKKLLRLRHDELQLCQQAGWLDSKHELMDGIWSGIGPFTENETPYMDVYRKIVHLPAFLELPADRMFIDLMTRLLSGPALMHNRRIGRITFPNNIEQTTGTHQDFVYIKGTPQTYTIWMPVGDCPTELGGLAILDASHKLGLLPHQTFPTKKYAGTGIDDSTLPPDLNWHAGDMRAGDLLLFHSYTVHKALPNRTTNRLRLSVDNRYQLANEAIEPSSMGTHYNL